MPNKILGRVLCWVLPVLALAGQPAAAQNNPLSADTMSQILQQVDPSTIASVAASAGVSVPTSGGGIPASLPSIGGAASAPPPGATTDPSIARVTPQGPPQFDYRANLTSPVFGMNLFTGTFARASSSRFNPDYVIGTGDRINVRLWGAYTANLSLAVDPGGNVFLPSVGAINIRGVRNANLQSAVEGAVARSFRRNVYVYASLAEAEPVRVFVTGFVQRPGLYEGTSMASLLHYLDQAGGIDPTRGSFIQIQVKRGEQVRARVNLYEFLFRGVMPLVNLSDGDVIFVGPRQNTVSVAGLAENAKIFEFPTDIKLSSADLALMARPLAAATNMRVTRNTGTVRNTEYYALSEAASVSLGNGDEVEFTADKKPGTITVRVEGEHDSVQEYVMPHGARLGELLQRVQFSNRSVPENIQLFRTSVQQRQKEMLEISLKALESAALNARSGTSEEARLRAQESEMILQWVDRARKVTPVGQVVLGSGADRDDLQLENGDRLRVPGKDGLVLISGDVLFPNAVIWDRGTSVGDYIARAGGYSQKSSARRIVIAHQNGSFDSAEDNTRGVRPGDEILVLPKIDTKSRQLFKDLTQILYQIAVSARVVLAL